MSNDLSSAKGKLDMFKYMRDAGLFKSPFDVERKMESMFGKNPPTPPPPPNTGVLSSGTSIMPEWNQQALMRMLAMRMRLPEGATMPFDFITAYKNGDQVVVFFVHKGSPSFLEDGWELFPSDNLITKLRLLG